MKKLLLATAGGFTALLFVLNVNARETVKTMAPVHIQGMSQAQQAAMPKMGAEAAPFVFIQNAGQVKDQYGNARHDIDYKLDVGGMVMFVGDGQVHYQWNRVDNSKVKSQKSKIPASGIESYRMDVTLLGANKNAVPIAEGMQQYKEMYYLPYHKDALVAHSYTRITYKNVYPHIDWVVYVTPSPKGGNIDEALSNNTPALGAGGSLKYDFIVNPGGNPADIKIQYNGTTSLALNNGALTATTPYGSITENAPYSYYAHNKQEVSSAFKLNGNILSYNITSPLGGGREGALVIDPQLLWGTYYGGSDRTFGGKVALDAAGCVYMVGLTESTSNIATTGSYQTSYAGGFTTDKGDGYLVKFTPEGKRVWATYYGGSNEDYFTGIAISGTSLYISGQALSSGLATVGSHQAILNGAHDALLVKFDTTGSRVWATYYGGSSSDDGVDVVCDGSGNVYLGGSTASTNGIATSGAYQPANAGSTDLFLAKFSSAGVRQWGTYFGGTANEISSGPTLACDASGNVYLAANMKSIGLGTTGTFQPAYSGSINSDVILVKFTGSGTLSWATYYGEVGLQTSSPFVTADASGNVYMTGICTYPLTGSSTYFATTSCYQSTYGGGPVDGFIAKFNSTGGRVWGTYYGASGDDRLYSIQLSPLTGNLYISGRSDMSGLATTEAYQNFNAGSIDAMVLVFTPGGSRVHVTYYGGSDYDDGGWLVPDNSGRLYMSGITQGTNGIATTSAFQTTSGNGGTTITSFLSAWVPDTAVFIKQPYIDTVLCAGDSLIIKDTVFYGFRSGNNFTVQLSNASGSFAVPTTIGTVTNTRVSGTIRCRIPITTAGGTGYRVRIVASNIPFTSADDYYNIRIKPNVQGFSASTNSPACEGDTIRLNSATTSTGVTWAWSGPLSYSNTNQSTKIGNVTAAMAGKYIIKATLTSSSCFVTDTQTVAVNPLPAKPTAGSNTPVCFGANIDLTANSTTTGVSYSWTGPNSFTSSLQNPSKTGVTVLDGGNYIVSATLNGCSTKDTETVVVYSNVVTPAANNNGPLCIGSDIKLTASNVLGATYNWTGPGYTSATQNPTITNGQLPNAGVYTVTATVNGCSSAPATTTVTLVQGPTVLIYPSPKDSICAGKSFTLNAIPTNPGTGATYQWYLNGAPITGATGIKYSTGSGTINGDNFSFVLTPGSGAACTTPVHSNDIPMTILQYMAPKVTMTASDTNTWPGLLVNFTATADSAGDFPKYQWKLNGKNVQGATSSTWGATSLNNNDSVCIEVTSSYLCANPLTATACKKVKIATGIHDVANNKLHIYPNPAGKELTIDGLITGTKIQLSDVYGRMVYSGTATSEKLTINTGNLVAGNYILQLTDATGARSSYKVVKE